MMVQKEKFLDRIGIPHTLLWGYVGVIIFMIGDGLEQGWLSPYLVQRGLSVQNSALLFTVYGITVTIGAWFSGVLVQAWGPRRTMGAGVLAFIAGSIGFISLGIVHLNFGYMLFFYAVKGFGYPLFAWSLLVWIAYSSPKQRMSTAAGWFWFVFSLGLSVIGPYYSSFMIPKIGNIGTLWTGIIFVLIGGFLAIVVNRDKIVERETENHSARELLEGITLLARPKILMGGIVKTINGFAQNGFLVFIPMYIAKYGFTTIEWLRIWGMVFTVAIVCNLIFGVLGDKIGWRNTVTWFGSVGCAVSTLIIYYTPQIFGHNYIAFMLAMCCVGVTMAGYVPMSALLPALAPENKGAAMSIVNLGSGLSTFLAPAVAGIFISRLGTGGVMYIYAGLYIISAILSRFLTLPHDESAIDIESYNIEEAATVNIQSKPQHI